MISAQEKRPSFRPIFTGFISPDANFHWESRVFWAPFFRPCMRPHMSTHSTSPRTYTHYKRGVLNQTKDTHSPTPMSQLFQIPKHQRCCTHVTTFPLPNTSTLLRTCHNLSTSQHINAFAPLTHPPTLNTTCHIFSTSQHISAFTPLHPPTLNTTCHNFSTSRLAPCKIQKLLNSPVSLTMPPAKTSTPHRDVGNKSITDDAFDD